MTFASTMTGYDICSTIAAILLPPLGVFMKRGLHSQFWLNVLLTLLGYLPGVVHALFVVARYRDHRHWPPATGYVV